MSTHRYEIKTVTIIGLGALGILFGNQLSKNLPNDRLRIIADAKRIKRYRSDGIYCNGMRCDFNYMTPDEDCEPADLVIFTVKYQGLKEAIKAVRNQVGENTIILSALNGITSEEIIGDTYGIDKLLYCVAQGMDAVKVGNQLSYDHMGMLVFGGKDKTEDSAYRIKAISDFFEQTGIPYQIDHNMQRRMWGKFMLNVGVNQTAAVSDPGNYGILQRPGEVRERMIAAMREVIRLSKYENCSLTDDDLNYWLSVLGTLQPQGKPSMRQDVEAMRYSEVELFAGTVLQLGRKYGVDTPVNSKLYREITELESSYQP